MAHARQNVIDYFKESLSVSKEEVWLMCHSSTEQLAKNIVERCEIAAQTNELNVRRAVSFKKIIHWDHFADGFPNIFIDDVKEMAGKDVVFLASFHSPQVIFEQLSCLYAIPRYLARSFCVILPYFATGIMEKIDKEGQCATAKTLATLLSHIPLTARGPATIVMFDIHALQERFYFGESVIPRLVSAIPLIQQKLKSFEASAWCIAFADAGAKKRFSSFFINDTIISCIKEKVSNEPIVKLSEGNPIGKHVLIVDDLVLTGKTLIACAKVLKKAGARSISAYVTHAVFPNETWRRFTDGDVVFENFWITDSIPHAEEISKHKPFKLLSIASVIADVLWGFDLKSV